MPYATPSEIPDSAVASVATDHLPLISVITPSYNQGKFIAQTIESVLGQDYPKLEYWVIDGGSTDNTLAVLRRYEADPRLRWVSEPDKGQSNAINKGLTHVRGDLFSWLNSDDILERGALSQVARVWQAYEPAVIYGMARFIDEAGHDLGRTPGQTQHMTLARLLHPARYSLVQPSTFAPTELVRTLGGVDETLHFMMDLDLWVRLGQQIPFRFVPYSLARYRLHAHSKTISLARRFIQDIDRIMVRAIRSGLLTARQAQVQLDLFAARVYLTSQPKSLAMAVRRLTRAALLDPSVGPEALFMLAKGLGRATLGEKGWSTLRRWQPIRIADRC